MLAITLCTEMMIRLWSWWRIRQNEDSVGKNFQHLSDGELW